MRLNDLQYLNGLGVLRNTIRVGRIIIMINPTSEENTKDVERIISTGERRFHFFYNNTEKANDIGNFSSQIGYIVYSNRYHLKYTEQRPLRIVVHVPHNHKDIAAMIRKIMEDTINDSEFVKWTIVTERYGPIFKIPGPTTPYKYPAGKMETNLAVLYGWNDISVNVTIGSIFPIIDERGLYKTHKLSIGGQGPIDTVAKQMHPEMFREEIIKEFKRSTPDGILKAIGSDDDIWNYIMMTGEWSIHEEGDRK